MDTNVLMERETAGLKVKLSYWGGEAGLADPSLFITVAVGENIVTAEVPADKALDAFHHPAIYLPAGQLAEMGVR